MPRRNLHTADRERSIIRAACQEIEEKGVSGISLTAIAKRAGVSRQWLYGFFPDLESLLMAIFRLAQGAEVQSDRGPEAVPVSVNEYLKGQTLRWITMPVAAAQVALYGTYSMIRGGPGPQRLHALMTDAVAQSWVKPLGTIGVSRSVAWSAGVTVSSAAYAERLAIHQGLTTRHDAREHLLATIDAVIPPTWVLG